MLLCRLGLDCGRPRQVFATQDVLPITLASPLWQTIEPHLSPSSLEPSRFRCAVRSPIDTALASICAELCCARSCAVGDAQSSANSIGSFGGKCWRRQFSVSFWVRPLRISGLYTVVEFRPLFGRTGSWFYQSRCLDSGAERRLSRWDNGNAWQHASPNVWQSQRKWNSVWEPAILWFTGVRWLACIRWLNRATSTTFRRHGFGWSVWWQWIRRRSAGRSS